jgi:hypothetical protein
MLCFVYLITASAFLIRNGIGLERFYDVGTIYLHLRLVIYRRCGVLANGLFKVFKGGLVFG